jgi:serine/threonine protein kinase
MHRDIKPENILLNQNGDVKLADFGFAKSRDPSQIQTDYISTRWYRAPEILLKKPDYSFAVDIFALGCVAAELMLLSPLFAGKNEIDHFSQILNILGNLHFLIPET